MELSPFNPAFLESNVLLKMYHMWSVVLLQSSLQPLLAGSKMVSTPCSDP